MVSLPSSGTGCLKKQRQTESSFLMTEGIGNGMKQILVLALSHTSSVNLGNLLNISKLQFSAL